VTEESYDIAAGEQNLDRSAGDGGNVWERPREVLETVASAGYDGGDLTVKPVRIDLRLFSGVAVSGAITGSGDTGIRALAYRPRARP
jgi:hypothetical protein